jgi:hypothetical protein
MADGNPRLNLNELVDEVIRRHRLTSASQSIVPAAQDFARQVGPDRMAMAFMEMAGMLIRARVEEQARDTARNPVPEPVKPRTAPLPVRIPPGESAREPEVSEVPAPESLEEFKPNSVLWHSTQSDRTGDEEAPAHGIPVSDAPPPPAPAAPLVRLPAPRPAPAVQQPSSRLAAMRSMTPEETWGVLAELVDVGGVSKPRKDMTVQDAIARYAFTRANEKDAGKRLTEAQKHFSREHREFVLAGRELDALKRHDAETISDLPDYELERLYGRRAA